MDVVYSHVKGIHIGGCSGSGKSAAVEMALNRSGEVYSKIGEVDDKFYDGYDPVKHNIILFNDI